MVTIAFTGGGTGGHIFPGLALLPQLRNQFSSPSIFWIGSKKGMDRSIVEAAGLEFFGIPSGKLRRSFSLRNFFDFFRVAAGFFAARSILKRKKPVLLFSKGGFVSVPPCAAAASLGIPVFTHESDYSPGLATRINAIFAEKIFVPYEATGKFFKEKIRDKVIAAGNPIRAEFRDADPQRGRAFLGLGPGDRILLVLGGSLGAREVNALIQETLPELTKDYVVIHQTGDQSGGSADGEGKNGERYQVYPFIKEELPHILAAAELVICRCGAGTLWECASLRKPLIMIPLRGSGTRGDQVENARIFEEAGAGIGLHGAGSAADQLAEIVSVLAGDEKKREAMSTAAGNLVFIDASIRIVNELKKYIEEKI
ncbi:UDP-N-acetylglucosamine--N-acetylmuramyl-(pentapeptide) pyrophosphoryl-undecaprenol N-acetylglucosamine transferase [Spirochaetia bacterium]|nr:UDP-N-acetylglucosamine--N-acetylmuramyl-(pentapeptide) pyrophosphoryl-undecaprenol N-acetylglucosamine transferase [Spirochaetia bacterium]